MHCWERQEWDKNKTPTPALTHDSASLRKCKKVQKELLVWGSWLAGIVPPLHCCQYCCFPETSLFLLICRPISASFLIRMSGKEYHRQAGCTTPLPPSSPWHSRENVRKWKQHGSKKALVFRSNLFLYSCCLQKPPELFCYRVVMIQKLKVSVRKYFLLLWPG